MGRTMASRDIARLNTLRFISNNKALIILCLGVAIAAILSPAFFTSRNVLNVLRQICTGAVLSLGFTAIISSGNLDLSVGYQVGMIGAEMALLSNAGLPFFPTILIGMLSGAFCGFVNGIIGVTLGLPMLIITLANGQIFSGITLLITGNSPVKGLSDGFKAAGQGYFLGFPIPFFILAFMVLLICLIVNKTVFGRHLIATGGNKEAAHVSGIDTKKVLVLTYMLMGVCAAVAAVILTGRAMSAQPGGGKGMERDCVAAVVIGGSSLSGGSAKIVGTVVGCLIVGVINNLLNLLGVDSNWQYVAKGLLILVAVGLDVFSTKIIQKSMERV